MKKYYLFIFLTIMLFITACGGISITTPSKDAAHCQQLLDNCNSVKDVREVARITLEYLNAYEQAFHNGDIVADEYREFLMKMPNEYVMQSRISYFQEFGPNK